MAYLLDTHSFLWFLEGNKSLSKKAKDIIVNPKNKTFISIASIWEMGIKISLDKLRLDVTLEELKEELIKNEIEILPLDFDHIIELSKLEYHHRDPFDRILISQAKSEKLTILSKDSHFKLYKHVKVIW
ncbi:MAG: type II toxin-antitoxin system VapC family toxin [Flavobacteriales bacterium]|jgi:PIN domain nuclease of toxin-antitoxin system